MKVRECLRIEKSWSEGVVKVKNGKRLVMIAVNLELSITMRLIVCCRVFVSGTYWSWFKGHTRKMTMSQETNGN